MKMDSTPIPRDAARLLLRLPQALHEQLRDIATDQGVSVNTLIVALVAGAIHFEIPACSQGTARTQGIDGT